MLQHALRTLKGAATAKIYLVNHDYRVVAGFSMRCAP